MTAHEVDSPMANFATINITNPTVRGWYCMSKWWGKIVCATFVNIASVTGTIGITTNFTLTAPFSRDSRANKHHPMCWAHCIRSLLNGPKQFTINFYELMSADAERCLRCYMGWHVQYFTSQHPFPEDSRVHTVIQCVGHIAFDVYRVDQKSLEENSGY